MSDRIDRSGWPSPRGPWPEGNEESRLYDHGQPWCVNAAAHPDANHGYPDAERHLPWHECRSAEAYVDDARHELDGAAAGVCAYAAAAFQFGDDRADARHTAPRIVIESWQPDNDQLANRISLPPGEALRLARILVHLADQLIFVRRDR